jgi:spermidine synthase
MARSQRTATQQAKDLRPKEHASAAMLDRPPVAVLAVLFAASGCSALIYEVVWFQWLEFIIGSSGVSLGILLAVFMGGLALGSVLTPHILRRIRSPLMLYAGLEVGIAVSALLIEMEVPLVRSLYSAVGGQGGWSLTLRGIFAGTCLLPPAAMMGATLPAIARLVPANSKGMSWLGLFYSTNTIGGVVGCLLAGFYLLRVHSMPFATYVAVGLNLLAASFALVLGRAPAARVTEATVPERIGARQRLQLRSVELVAFLSGFCALGGEVVWTRLLALLLGSTVYTFSIILAVYLFGIALGSGAGTLLVRLGAPVRSSLGVVQLLVIPAALWASYLVSASLPYWPITPGIARDPWVVFQLDVVRCLWALLPVTTLWGATMPLALGLTSDGRRADQHVGSIYAANTLGAILGALAFTFIVIPLAGTARAQQTMLWISLAAGAVAILPLVLRPQRLRQAMAHLLLIIGGVVATAVLVGVVPSVPGELIAFGRSLANRLGTLDPRTGTYVPLPRLLYVGEGLNESVAVTTDDRVRLFHVSGKIEASTSPKDMRLQRLLACVPSLIHEAPSSVLIVGFGSGVTAGTFLEYPSVKRVVICELEPLIPKRVAEHFADVNQQVATDPRVTIVYDDARHYMLTSKEKFDIITSDPIHPWVKGSAALYSKEYFELVRKRLNPGGLVTQWVPLYQSSEGTIKSELATFMSVFSGGTVWANRDRGLGYDLVLLGSLSPQVVNVDALDARWRQPDYAAVRRTLEAVGFGTWADVLATYAGRHANLVPWLAGAAINDDQTLRLQYQAGLESLLGEEAKIYARMTEYRSFPSDLFVGSPEAVQAVMDKGAE